MDKREFARFRKTKEFLDKMFENESWYVGTIYWTSEKLPVGLQVCSLEDSELVARMIPDELNGVIIDIWAGPDARERFEMNKPKEDEEVEELRKKLFGGD